MLLPAEVDLISKKKSGKRNSVWPIGSSNGKMVLTLPTKIVTFHIRPIMIDVRGFGLKFVLGQ